MNKLMIISCIGMLCLFFTFSAFSQETGLASYYHSSLKGSKMSNGERYDPEGLTCAHLTAPLGSLIKIARKDNPDFSVIVTVTDRGPHVKGRIIDLSRRAARELGIIDRGISEVVIALITKPDSACVPLVTSN